MKLTQKVPLKIVLLVGVIVVALFSVALFSLNSQLMQALTLRPPKQVSGFEAFPDKETDIYKVLTLDGVTRAPISGVYVDLYGVYTDETGTEVEVRLSGGFPTGNDGKIEIWNSDDANNFSLYRLKAESTLYKLQIINTYKKGGSVTFYMEAR